MDDLPLDGARAALAKAEAPRCGASFRPDPRYTDTDPCGLAAGHEGRCGHRRADDLSHHLRDALAAVDILTAEVARLNALLSSAARSILANRQAELDAARHEGRRERGAEIAAWLSLPCGLADHDDRWCPVCNDRSELADSIKRGAGRKDGAAPWVE